MIVAALLFASAQTLVGDWALVDAHRDASMPVEECATDYGLSYAADGTWRTFFGDESGTWSRKGDVASERVTRREDDVNGDRAVREHSYSYRLRWFGPDHVNIVNEDGASGMIRCPPAP